MKPAALAMCAAFATAMLMAMAQAEQTTIPRIGVLAAPVPYEEGLREGLMKLGYVEGRSIAIDWRRSAGEVDDLGSLTADLAHSQPALIVAFGTLAARTVLQVSTVPMIFFSSDPVTSGLVTNLARPGGNATGVSSVGRELTGKRLQLLLQFAPGARRIGCLVNTSNPVGAIQLEEAETAARALEVELVKFDARNDTQIDAAVRAISRSGINALLVTGDNLLFANGVKISRAVRKARLPAMFPVKEYRGEGVLASYGPSLREAGRMTAVYVDKVIRGARPGDLPVEEISKLELVINLRVAKAQGIKVPKELLYRADEVIR